MRVLITGASGQVGSALLRSLPSGIEVHAPTREQLDVADARAVHAAVTANQPEGPEVVAAAAVKLSAELPLMLMGCATGAVPPHARRRQTFCRWC